MSLLYRALLGFGVCVLLGTSYAGNADAITWDFGGSGGLRPDGASLSFTSEGVTVTATGWNYYATTTRLATEGFKDASLFQGGGGLGVCADSEVSACLEKRSGDYQVDNYGHDDYVMFVFSAPTDQFTVRIDPESNTTPLGWDRDVSYWLGNVSDPSSFNLTDVTYTGLTNLGFSSGYSNGTQSNDYRDVSIFSPTSVNVLIFGAKRGGEYDLSDRFMITSVSSVPEPSSMLLLVLGVSLIGLVSMRRNQVNG